MNLKFETMDWEAEAKRVAGAFGLKEECYFLFIKHIPLRELRNFGPLTMDNRWLATKDGDKFSCVYREQLMFFSVQPRVGIQSSCSFYYDGKIEEIPRANQNFFVRALFHLDLLTPQVEAALKVNISAHQKLEWTLEFDFRNSSPASES